MNLLGRMRSFLLTLWIVAASLIYLRQFGASALLYLSRALGHP